MESVRIRVSKIWEPKLGKTNYNIVDEAGNKYSTSPQDALKVKVGDLLDLDYEDKEHNGFAFKATKRLAIASGNTNVTAPTPQSPPPRTTVVVPQGLAKDGGFRTPRQSFVSDVLAGAMRGGHPSDDIEKIGKFALAFWDNFLVEK